MSLPLEALGDSAVRFPLPEDLDRAATLAALRALPGVRDVVFTDAHGAVVFDGDPPDVAACLRRGEGLSSGRRWRIGVRYDGPDLARVAAWSGVSEAEVVRRHARTYVVRFLGFLPGFAYLGEVDPCIAAPRLPSPRPRVPPGSVAIAGGRTGIYPSASPGGWNLVGRVEDFVPFDLNGARLAPGDFVTFEAV